MLLIVSARYVLQSGAWTAFSLELGDEHSAHERDMAYKYMNLFYQVLKNSIRAAG